jgi:hypothetical protein
MALVFERLLAGEGRHNSSGRLFRPRAWRLYFERSATLNMNVERLPVDFKVGCRDPLGSRAPRTVTRREPTLSFHTANASEHD